MLERGPPFGYDTPAVTELPSTPFHGIYSLPMWQLDAAVSASAPQQQLIPDRCVTDQSVP
jgi:hypothetical protein